MNGITRAAELHLRFGRDIVFTFGPLGYFIVGVKTPESFRHVVAAKVAIAVVFSVAALWYCRTLSLRRFLISFFAIGFALVLAQDRTAAVIGAFVAVAALVLDRRSTLQPYEALIIGILAGFGALTKFTIGMQCAGAIGSVLLFGALQESRIAATEFFQRRSLGIFVVSALATMSAALAAAGSTAVNPIVMAFALWSFCVCALVATIVLASRDTKLLLAPFILSAMLAIALLVYSGAIDFVRNSLQISFGYSDAMISIPDDGGASGVLMGVLLLALVALVALLERPVLSFGAVFGLFVLSWLNFKEGYVRQDAGHIVEFLIPILFVFALLTVVASTRRKLALSLLAFSAAFYSTVAEMLPAPPSQDFSLSRFSASFNDIADAFGKWPSGNDPSSGMASDLLDAGTARKLASLPIDVQSTEATIAFANALSWRPEPVFQAYSAYTPALDRLNAVDLETAHRRVLVDTATIDGRDFMEESPLARRELLCRYELDPQFGEQLVRVTGGERFAVLSFSRSKHCRSGGIESLGTIAWDRRYAMPPSAPGSMTFLALKIRYSLRGTLVKTAIRGPLVTLSLRDRSGRTTTFRLLTQNAINGFLVSPNPLSTADFARLFAGTLPATTDAFSIHTDDPGAYENTIDASLESVSFADGLARSNGASH